MDQVSVRTAGVVQPALWGGREDDTHAHPTPHVSVTVDPVSHPLRVLLRTAKCKYMTSTFGSAMLPPINTKWNNEISNKTVYSINNN
jgi:hypothetical protein